MANGQKQAFDIKSHKGIKAALSNELQRRWSDEVWKHALTKEDKHYDRSRDQLNFEIAKGGKVQKIDKSKTVGQKMKENLAARGIKDRNEGLSIEKDEGKFRTLATLLFTGNPERMRELAFGNQKLDRTPGVDNSHLKRMPQIEEWAKDIYKFCCKEFGEENIVGFYVHLDETTPHIHAAIIPVHPTRNKISWKSRFGSGTYYENSNQWLAMHDRLAMVNKRWGLERGESVKHGDYKKQNLKEYHHELKKKNKELEGKNQQLYEELQKAYKRVKGLAKMIENNEAKRTELVNKISELQRQCLVDSSNATNLKNEIAKLQGDLDKVKASIEDKSAKLIDAERILDDLRDQIKNEQKLYEETVDRRMSEQEQLANDSTGLASKTALDMILESLGSVRDALPNFQRELFDDSLAGELMKDGNEVAQIACCLFAGAIDQALEIADPVTYGGGGGSTSDLPWRRLDDEDDEKYMRRCIGQARRMKAATRQRSTGGRRK
ncbi:MAG: plasmid recombination protein [Bacteroidales bacterium]|nr:plasmid recombination protein [Bacteroidales bacterium]